MKVTVTNHAIDMWNKRTGALHRTRTRANNQILAHVSGAKQISSRRWYANGWVFVIQQGKVLTCYRPAALPVMNEVYQAHQIKP